MKKLILSSAILLFAFTGYCQISKPVKIDSLVTVSLPPTYFEKDTLGQHIFSGNGLTGFMEVIKSYNVKNTAPLKRESDLNKVFKDYVNTIQSQSDHGVAENVRDTIMGTLKAKLFTLREANPNGNVQLRNFVLIYTTEASYTFEYVYPEYRKELVSDEYLSYINSIKFSRDLQRNDQYLLNTKGLSAVVTAIIFGGGALLIAFVVLFIVRWRKRLALG